MIGGKELLDLQFIDARARLIDLAAFLDRSGRHGGDGDVRVKTLRKAIPILLEERPDRARGVLEAFSDLGPDLPQKATCQGATGAPPN